MEQLSNEILLTLNNKTNKLNNYVDNLHYIPPSIEPEKWLKLGDYITKNEKKLENIQGKNWYTLRLDGHGFSKTIKQMRKTCLLPEKNGYSEIFASIMIESTKKLMKKFNANTGYTQSDEIIIFIPPCNIIRGKQQEHIFNGRIQKICSLAASFVTSVFVSNLAKLNPEKIDKLIDVIPHFDCRIASWRNWNEAYSLLLWRANDCAMNGVSDAIYSYNKELVVFNRSKKIEWLFENNKLPLPKHQAYGTMITYKEIEKEGYNPILKKKTLTKRKVLVEKQEPILKINKDQIKTQNENNKKIYISKNVKFLKL